MTAPIEPYRVEVPETVLEDLRERLHRTRWPDQLPEVGWEPGAELGAVRDLCNHWAHGFDWRAVEARLNDFEQFVTETPGGERLHFLHVRSPEAGALPLVLTHGWPGSVVEFLDVIGPLADPVAHGGDAGDAFHVVVPSIPGYGFSGPTRRPGFHAGTMAEAVVALMADLGYDRYGAQGGDWGSEVTRRLGRIDAEHVAGIHVNMMIVGPPAEGAFDDVSEAELAALGEGAEMAKTGIGYLQLQSTKPQTLSYGLTDSPAGLAAWLLEKFHAWTDHGPDEVSALSDDQMLADITTYWVTGTANSAARLYWESARARTSAMDSAGEGGGPGFIEVPTGYAAYPGELIRPPRSWIEATCNLVHMVEMPRGGHFAAWEQPDLFVDDLRTFFRLVR